MQFGYLVNSGPPGSLFPATQVPNAVLPTGPQARDWYYIQAKGNTDDDADIAYYAATSVNGEVFADNPME